MALTTDELQLEFNKVKQEKLSLSLKISAISLGGSVAGVLYANNKKESLIGKIGWFILGGIIVSVPSTLIFANKAVEIDNRYKQLQDYLKKQGAEIN